MAVFRNEWKFYCTESDLAYLEARIRHIMQPDRHQKGKAYKIRSVYFDDFDNRCYHDNLGGLSERQKFRIRIYDNSIDLIRLEIKRKINNLSFKETCPLTYSACQKLIKGDTIQWREDYPAPLASLYRGIHEKGLHPVCIVDYERTAYTYPVGNVRVTFDRNLSGSAAIIHFFEPYIPLIPVMPPGIQLLEIKFDEFLPDYIAGLLDIGKLNQIAFSKYVLCREHIDKPEGREVVWESMN